MTDLCGGVNEGPKTAEEDKTCREVCIAGSDISASIGNPTTGRQLDIQPMLSDTVQFPHVARTAAPPAMVPKRPGVGSFDFLSSPRLNRETGMTFLTV